VIWDNDVRVIVMLTAESEGGQLKCHPYWTSQEYGSIKLRLLSEKKVSLDMDKHRSHSQVSSMSSSSNNSDATITPQGPQGPASSSEQGRRRANTTTTLEASTPTPVQPRLTPSSSQSETPYVIIRKFALNHNEHPFARIREITHLHYPSWPDFGAPAQPSHLLGLVELANVMQRAALPLNVAGMSGQGAVTRSSSLNPTTSRARPGPIPLGWQDESEADDSVRPMLVHCSAGCGRTGTFCTVDSVIDMLKRQQTRSLKRAKASFAASELQARKTRRVEIDADGDFSMDEYGSGDDRISPTSSPPTGPAVFSRRLNTMPDAPPAGGTGFSFPASLPLPPVPGFESPVEADRDGDDIDLRWMDDDSVDLIAKTVEDFRMQRISMVQSLRQFVLCYETIAEWIWRIQERSGTTVGPRGRGRSGSLQVPR